MEYLTWLWDSFVTEAELELDVTDEKLFLGNVDRLDRKLWSLVIGLFGTYLFKYSIDWGDLLYLGDSGVWFMDGLLPINTGILDFEEFLRFFSGDLGDTNTFSTDLFLL